MGTFTNSEDPDEMQHNVSKSSDKIIQYRYIQWTIQSLLYQTIRNNPLVYKEFKLCILIDFPI